MELPTGCWRCGSLHHHRQACTEEVAQTDEVRVLRLSKRIANEARSINFLPNERELGNAGINFPVVVLSDALHTYTDKYLEIKELVDDLGRPTIILDDITALLDSHHALNLKLLDLRKTDKELTKDCKKRQMGAFSSHEEGQIFYSKWNDYHQLRQDVYNTSNRLTMWCFNARASAKKFWDAEHELTSFISNGLRNMGRPTLGEFRDFKEEVENKEKCLSMMITETDVFKNICSVTAANDASILLRRIRFQFRLLKEKVRKLEVEVMDSKVSDAVHAIKEKFEKQHEILKQENEDLKLKLLCGLCLSEDKSWSLLCGHLYCDGCITELGNQRYTESIPLIVDGVTFQGNVALPIECAFCRGSLDGKHRIFF